MRTVYKNGTIYTGNGFVTDFAVENGKFCFVGETDKATADEVVDLGGKFVCAGFKSLPPRPTRPKCWQTV